MPLKYQLDNMSKFNELREILSSPGKAYATHFISSVYYKDYVKYVTRINKYNQLNNNPERYRCDDRMMTDYYIDNHALFINRLSHYESLCHKYNLI